MTVHPGKPSQVAEARGSTRTVLRQDIWILMGKTVGGEEWKNVELEFSLKEYSRKFASKAPIT